MRKAVQGAGLLCVAVAVAGCAFTTVSQTPATVDGALPSALGAPSADPVGLLPIPSGATPWTSNTDAPMSLAAFVDEFFIPSAQVHEKSLYTRRGFVSGGFEGWINLDGSQQRIAIARFATANGALSAFDDLSTVLSEKPAPWTKLSDSADGAVGAVNPQLDSDGNALVDITARVGDYLVDVHQYTAATPDPSAARALLEKQVDALKSKPAAIAGGARPSAPSAPSAAGAPTAASTPSAGPLGLLSIPAGATAWNNYTDAPLSLGPYIDKFWASGARAVEKSEYAQWGFVSGGINGWINVDGSQQSIAIARFSTVTGAINAFDELSSALADKPAPATTFAGPVDQAVGSIDPQLDSHGNAVVEIAARVGDYLVDVHEFSAMTPDPGAAKTLFLAHVNALTSDS